MFTKEEYQRYSRHFLLPQIGEAGQQRLKQSSVLCIGSGGLGSPLLLYLAAAGVGHIGIIDADVVDDSNLQRQIIHSTKDVGKKKVQSAKETLTGINPYIQITTYDTWFTQENARDLVKKYDIVVDGCDNFSTRYLSNDVCFFEKKPNVYGSIFQFEGQASVFAPHLDAPCYRCVFPEPPNPKDVPSCAEAGVLGVLPGIIGSFQALEVIKLVTGIGESLFNRLVYFDALSFNMRTLKINKNPNCPLCGTAPSILELKSIDEYCKTEVPTDEIGEITVIELKEKLAQKEGIVLDVRESYELEICKLQNSIHIPLGELANRLTELDTTKTYYTLCHHGVRSLKAHQLLKENNINSFSIKGGINTWAEKIDPKMTTY